jgi:hypothetical protein
MRISGTWTFGFLRVVGCCSSLVNVIVIFDLYSCADYCDGVATCLCSGIEICEFPRDDVVLHLLLLACLLLALVLAVL